MSLLDKTNEDIIVYPEEVVIDSDGNIKTQPSAIGIPTRALIQIENQSGTSARRSEQDNEGYESEQVYRLRFARNNHIVLSAQARIDWKGQYWAVIGEPSSYNGGARTRHTDYSIRRN